VSGAIADSESRPSEEFITAKVSASSSTTIKDLYHHHIGIQKHDASLTYRAWIPKEEKFDKKAFI
jgi:hypothetical protein